MSSYAIGMVSANLTARSASDRRMYFLTDGILLPIITLGIWNLVVLYRQISRRDQHFRREEALNYDLLMSIKERIRSTDVDPHSLAEVAALESAIRQKAGLEQPKGPALWLILSLITGIAGIYVTYFLTIDYFHHEQRELDVVSKANAALARAGLQGSLSYKRTLSERHFWLNLLAAMVTLGIWGIVWQYREFSDPNRHFENQWTWEDSLATSLS
ncbi:MAG: DUF4234 domain-containing protein [Chloroflexi bacterium]|nr:DUF4234 domain-containing protein [Chloroflexota bacterium]